MYFAQYMDEHLIHGGDMLNHRHNQPAVENREPPSGIFMKKWFRTNKAIVMYLSNGTLQVNLPLIPQPTLQYLCTKPPHLQPLHLRFQVNFFEDHTKVILSPDNQDYILTYVNNSRSATTYKLLQLRSFGATPDIIERLSYSRRMLENIINIEGEAV